MRTVLKRVKALSCLLILASCQGTNSEKEKPNGPRGPLKPQEPSPIAKCVGGEIHKILKDGRTVLAKVKDSETGLVLWDALTGEVRRKIDYAFNLLDISHNGEFVLQEISKRSYRVLSIVGDQINYSEGIRFRSGTKADLKFSHQDDFLFSKIKLYRNKFKVNVFDINKRDLRFSKFVDDLKVLDMYSRKLFGYVHSNFGWGNSIKIYDLESGKGEHYNIKSGKVQNLVLTENLFVVRVNNRYFVYDRFSGKFKHSFRVDFVYNVDRFSEKVLASIENELKIIDLNTAEIMDVKTGLKDVVLSTCVLNFDVNEVLCKSQSEPNKILIHNLTDNSEKLKCLN